MDLAAGIVERHTEPRDGLYRQITITRADDTLASTVLAELIIPVNTVLGIGEAL